jgi:HD-GYP domain-containing protein (c-di-GMP phosphodiesterase class II)
VADAERPGDEDLDVRLSWPDHEAVDPPPARGTPRDAGNEPDLDEVDPQAISEAATQSLKALRREVAERQRQLVEHSEAQQAELTRLSESARDELKRMFADHAGELERLVRESDHEMSEVVRQHVAEVERSISASAADINDIADQRFAEFDRMVASHVDAIEEATTRSLIDIDAAIEHRIGDLEERLLAWIHAHQSQFAKGADAVARQGRLTLRFATIALVFAVIAVGLGVGLLLAR